MSEFEKYLVKLGNVNVGDVDSTILVDLKYSTKENFLGFDIYGEFNEAYLQKEVAGKLKNAQQFLRDTLPGYRLIIYDALRPQSYQKVMWDSIKVPEEEKHKYLSKPEYGSVHNFGAAVDVSIVGKDGKVLDMGTAYDSFEELAYPMLEERMFESGLLSEQQISNRKLLRRVMETGGFFIIQTEWWHFNSCSRTDARGKYAMVESHLLKSTDPIPVINSAKQNEIAKARISFKVQICTSREPIDVTSKQFKGLNVKRYFHKGLYKYTVGYYKNIISAHEMMYKVRDMGFKQAFVAGFNFGKRIGIRDAMELIQ